MKITKRLLAVLLTLVLLCVGVPFAANATTIVASGTCGDNLMWTLDTNGKLTITGTGTMQESYTWFSQRNNIKSISIGSGVTSIASDAFRNCYSLTSVAISSSVRSIGSYAFEDCTRLTSITIPDSVTSIGDGAFFVCSGLTSITIPNSVTSIGEEVFSGCSSLMNVTIGDGVTSIGERAFASCTALESVTIPDSVANIGAYAFSDCIALQTATIGNSVTSIGENAFNNCYGLTSVSIGNSVTSIGDSAFSGCSHLKSVTFPDSVTSIGFDVFYLCSNLTALSVSEANPLYSSDDSGCLYSKNKTNLIQYPIGNTRKSFSIPDSVTSIDRIAFFECSNLTSVMIPSSVTRIGLGTFYGCSNLNDVYYTGSEADWNAISIGSDNTALTSATIHYNYTPPVTIVDSGYCGGEGDGTNLSWTLDSDGLLTISGTGAMGNYSCGTSPFYANRTNIESVSISDSVTSIGDWAFYYCRNLTSVTIPNNVTSIGIGAFKECSSLTSVTIPDSVTSIGYAAFYNCDGLESIVIPDSVTTMGIDNSNSNYGVFYGCVNLRSVVLGNGLNALNPNAFCSCSKLESVTIGNSVTYIGNDAFDACHNLTYVTIGNSVKYIGSYAFYNCSSLTSVTIPDSVTGISGEAFCGCSALIRVTFGNNVKYIGDYAFTYCRSLTSVIIPDSVTHIGIQAFNYCSSLTSLVIGKGIETIDIAAFESCDKLENIYYTGTPDEWAVVTVKRNNKPLTNATIHYLSSDNYQVGDFVYFGTYPQTRVDETPELQAAASSATWKSYDYYTGTGSWADGNMTPSDYMKFADFFCDGSKYRAVKFTKYRQWNTGYQAGETNTYQDDNGYSPNTTYYFKYEPLTWRVLDPSTGYIMCESIVDSQAYQNTIYNNGSVYVQAINSSVYANDYATSSIRTWLNHDFYETAFTASQKENIKTTALNNDAYSTSYSQYNSATTNDKIFLLSWADALNTSYGFSSSNSTSDAARRAQGTDYAICQGLSVITSSEYSGNSWWWLRSPGLYSSFACSVSGSGSASCVDGVNDTFGGVRPACKISNLTSDITLSDSLYSSYVVYNVGDQIQFGTYPQTRVDETPELQAAAQAATWTSYNYYTGTGELTDGNMTPSDYMQFADFFCDGAKYRAVKFTQYRPDFTGHTSDISNTYQDDNCYVLNTVYYFKYELLTWRILDPTTGYVMCESLIDSQAYQNTVYKNGSEFYQANGSSVYAIDYATSSIRDWLNHDFYETAFTTGQKANIQETALNNNAFSTSYAQYNSVATNDYIFLPSCADVRNTSYGFSSYDGEYDMARRAKGTDYAQCQGLWVNNSSTSSYNGNSWWSLRTPGESSWGTCGVGDGGNLYHDDHVNYTVYGIRPACILSKLKSDITQLDALFSEEDHTHIPTTVLIENEVAATCKAQGSYDEVVYCSGCGIEISRTPHESDMLDHTPGEAVIENEVGATCKAKGSYDEVVYCTECGDELTRTPHETEMLDHTPGDAVIENEVAATCKAKGSYDEVVYCTECGDELTRTPRESDMLAHTPGEAAIENEVGATCKAKGSYDEVVYCTECGDELTRTLRETETLEHTPSNAVIENEVAATCKAKGSYDEVVYCTECGDELTRTPREIAMLAHTPGEAVIENEVAATCKAKGSYDEVVYCTKCGDELTRTPHETDMLRHVNAEPVKENEIAPTCTAGGSYDSVIYCRKCGDELNRETVSVQKLDHTPGAPTEESVRTATCTTVGEKKIVVRCTKCKNVLSEWTQEIPALHHSYVTTVTPATCTAVGFTTYTCERGDHSYVSDYTDMLPHRDGDNDGHCDVCKQQMTGGNYCKYCGKIHDGLFGWLVKFFHSILAIFKR